MTILPSCPFTRDRILSCHAREFSTYTSGESQLEYTGRGYQGRLPDKKYIIIILFYYIRAHRFNNIIIYVRCVILYLYIVRVREMILCHRDALKLKKKNIYKIVLFYIYRRTIGLKNKIGHRSRVILFFSSRQK